MWDTFESLYREDGGVAAGLAYQAVLRWRDVPDPHYAWVNGEWRSQVTIQQLRSPQAQIAGTVRGVEITDIKSLESYGRIVR